MNAMKQGIVHHPELFEAVCKGYNIDTTDFTEQTYIYRKTDRLLSWGVEKVIWVLSESKKVIVAEQGKDWLLVDWSKDIEIIDGIKFNVSQYLEKSGVKLI